LHSQKQKEEKLLSELKVAKATEDARLEMEKKSKQPSFKIVST
jgi:hypothetical protein